MGRIFDRIAGVFLLYILFMGATGDILAAIGLTYLTVLLLRQLKRRPRADISRLAFLPPAESEAIIRKMLDEKYSGTPLACVLRHPTAGKLTPAAIIDIWQAHRGEEKLIIAAVQLASPAAFDMAARLAGPEVCLIDGAMLAKYPISIPEPGCFKPRAKAGYFRRMLRAARRTDARKTLLTGCAMCLLFMVSGTGVYLLGGLILIFIGLSAVRYQRVSRELFS